MSSVPKPSALKSQSFDKIFEDAAAEFSRITKQDVQVGSANTLEAIMAQLEAKFEPEARLGVKDKEAYEKKKRTKNVVFAVLDGLSKITKIASATAGSAFPGANVCFDAVGWLLTVPKSISELWDGIGEVFQEINGYLVSSNVLRQVHEQTGKVAPELIDLVGEIMQSFVRICAYCYKAGNGRFGKVKTFIRGMLPDETKKVKGELQDFRDLVNRQDSLTGTLTYAAMLDTGKTVTRMDKGLTNLTDTTLDQHSMTRTTLEEGFVSTKATLHNEFQQHTTNMKQLIDRSAFKDLEDLARYLGLSDDPRGKIHVEQDNIRNDMLERTMKKSGQWLTEMQKYQQWLDGRDPAHRLLALTGSRGCGIHFLVSQVASDLADQCNSDWQNLVGYFQFTKSRSVTKHGMLSFGVVSSALRTMAWQMARDSAAFCQELLKSCRADEQVLRSQRSGIRELWSILRFASRKSNLGPTFVMVFDGFEQLDISVAQDLAEVLMSKSETGDQITDSTRLRVLIAGTEENEHADSKMDLFQQSRKIVVNDHNAPDITLFIQQELSKPIFDVLTRQANENGGRELRKAMYETLRDTVKGDFFRVMAKMRSLKAAIDTDDAGEDFRTIKQILCSEVDDIHNKLALDAIRELEITLRDEEKKQLNSALQWLMYARGSCKSSLLETVIARTAQSGPQLRTFTDKYRKILTVQREFGDEYVEINEEVYTYLEGESRRSSTRKSSYMRDGVVHGTMTINFNGTSPDDVKQFFFHLSKDIASEQGPFHTMSLTSGIKICVDLQESVSCIVGECLEVLTDEPDDKTAALASWATQFLPSNLTQDRSDDIGKAFAPIEFNNKKKVLKGLVSLLTNTQLTMRHWASQTRAAHSAWLEDHKAIETVDQWLHDKSIVHSLKIKHQRQLNKLLLENPGWGGFWKPLTVAIVKDWLFSENGIFEKPQDWIIAFMNLRRNTMPRSTSRESPLEQLRQQRLQTQATELVQNAARKSFEETVVTQGQQDIGVAGSENDQYYGLIDGPAFPRCTSMDMAANTTTEINEVANSTCDELADERIAKAADWVRKELDIGEPGSTWYIRLAESYVEVGANDKALELMKEATRFRDWKVFDRLSVMYEIRGEDKLAIEAVQTAIDILYYDNKPDETFEKRGKSYRTLTKLLLRSKRVDLTIEALRTATERQPGDHALRSQHIRVLQTHDQTDAAKILILRTHQERASQNGLTVLADMFYKLSDQTGFIEMCYLLDCFSRCDTTDLVLSALRTAITYARDETHPDRDRVFALVVFEAILLPIAHGQDGRQQALRNLLRELKDYNHVRLDGATNLAYVRARQLSGSFLLREDSGYTAHKQGELLKDLARHSWSDASASHTYLARYELGRDQKASAKELWGAEMHKAFEMLSNGDTSDDWKAFIKLATIFANLDEDINAWTAWSMVGPRYVVVKGVKTSLDFPSLRQLDEMDRKNQEPGESECFRRGDWEWWCNGGCSKEWTFADDFVQCKVCPGTISCRKCHDELMNGQDALGWCDRTHAFLRVPAWPADEGNADRDKVRVGGWARPDGEYMAVEEWLNGIRQEWDIESSRRYDWQSRSRR